MFPFSAWIPNGAQPAGTCESLNAPVSATGLNDESKTSTRALWKSVA